MEWLVLMWCAATDVRLEWVLVESRLMGNGWLPLTCASRAACGLEHQISSVYMGRCVLMPLIMRLERVLLELSAYTGDGLF